MKLRIRVVPNARKTMLAGYRDGELVLRLCAPALEGKANKAAVEFLADHFGVARARVALVSGEKSRHKIFEIVGLDASDVERGLAQSSR